MGRAKSRILVSTGHAPSEMCTHERRPGTTVCLRCRYDSRIAARARLKRIVLRAATVVILCVALVAAGTWLGAAALRSNRRRASERAVPGDSQLTVISASRISSSSPTRAAPRAVRQGEAVGPADAPFGPIVPVGETVLHDGVTAIRDHGTVTLSFDTPLARTRIPEKFEKFVRETLPEIYGPSVESVLARLARGGIALQGSLLTELPHRGVRIAAGDAWTIRLFPETRPGHDGPLVVRYRVSVVPIGQ